MWLNSPNISTGNYKASHSGGVRSSIAPVSLGAWSGLSSSQWRIGSCNLLVGPTRRIHKDVALEENCWYATESIDVTKNGLVFRWFAFEFSNYWSWNTLIYCSPCLWMNWFRCYQWMWTQIVSNEWCRLRKVIFIAWSLIIRGCRQKSVKRHEPTTSDSGRLNFNPPACAAEKTKQNQTISELIKSNNEWRLSVFSISLFWRFVISSRCFSFCFFLAA